jgi:N-acetylmuramoyl-L-alanine amidase
MLKSSGCRNRPKPFAACICASGAAFHVLLVACLCRASALDTEDIPAKVFENIEFLSVRRLAEQKNCSWQWHAEAQRMECRCESGEIVLQEGVLAARGQNRTLHLTHEPVFRDGGFFISATDARRIFGVPADTGAVTPDTKKASVSAAKSSAHQALGTPSAPAGPSNGADDFSIRTIVIDPGHGGKDPGAIGQGGVREKDIVLPIALAVRDELVERTDLTVYLTRSDDTFIELRERTDFANEKGADLFVSIHANSIGGSKKKREQVKGYKVYFLSEAKNEDDRRVAMMENSVVSFERKKSASSLQNILLNMAASEYLLESQDLSIMLAETFGASLKKIKKLHTGVGQGPFWVLFGASMPAVLIETGFISNSREEKLLSQADVQNRLASVICEAIILFKKRYEADQ